MTFAWDGAAKFQSTPLIRGATRVIGDLHTVVVISIHAPHTRGDFRMDSIVISATYFNPRPSYEGRLLDILLGYAAAVFQSTPLIRGATVTMSDVMSEITFQSTPLIRGATAAVRKARSRCRISIHAPHTRGDGVAEVGDVLVGDFNPRPSYEGRLTATSVLQATPYFNPRPSYEGRRLVCNGCRIS